MACLESYRWPGNVRELDNEMKRLAVTIRRARIAVPDLSESLAPRAISPPRPRAFPEASRGGPERRLIAAALEDCQRTSSRRPGPWA